ncbi:MAG: plasmid replication protein, CyRepA1 family [Cyanobacteria bacterium P01_H01_bin.35]
MILTENLLNRKENSLNDYGDFNHYGSSGSGQYHKWERFTRLKETCPICNGAHKRCTTNGSLVICGEDTRISGWKNLGQDKAGIGYLYRPDSSQSSEYKKLPKPVPAKPAKVSHLNQGDINNLLLDMLCQQPVEDWARADLLKRGVEPSGLLGKSFPKGVIDDRYEGLPGTYRDSQGRLRINVPNDSYFCPIFNEDGLVVGGQLKIKGGKYIWLSAGSKGGYNHHINGKTPHTLCNSNKDKRSQFFVNEGKGSKQRKNIILFSEGVLKPYIINQLSGYPCIGAVGGNFKGNFENIDKFIAKVTNNNPDQFTFAIAADAGSGINDLVVKQYKALVEHIKEKYNREIYVVWYSQYTKEQHLDFDDILATGKTKYQLIPFNRFVKKNEEFKALQEKKKFTAKHKFSERYLPVDDSYWGWENNPIVDFTKNVNKGVRTLLALKSPMGTGKTEALKKVLELLKHGIFLLGYRNSLLKQTGERIKAIYHITEIVNSLQLSATMESVSLCMDSLLRVQVTDVIGKVVVVDEAPLVLEHLLDSETCKGRRYRLRKHLRELLVNCAGVVIMSDQLTDREVKLIQELTGIKDEDTLTVENTFKMPSRKVIVYDSEKQLRQALFDGIEAGKRIFLATDSQKFTEVWGRKTTEEIKSDCRTLIINSETLYKKEVQDFLKDPNGHLSLYDFILASPTAESGLSIDEKGCLDAIFVRWTHLGQDACTQIMHRVRDTDCPVHLFAYRCRNGQKSVIDLHEERIDRKHSILAEKEKSDLRYMYGIEDASDEEKSDFAKFHLESNDSINNDIRDYEQSPLTTYLDELKEMRLMEQHSLRDLLVHDLKVRGYDVGEAPEVELNKDAINTNNQSEAIKEEKSLAILEAKILSDDEYGKLDRREVKTPQETAEIRKYDLLRSLPGIDKLEGWGVDLIKYLKFDKPNSMRQVSMRHLLNNEVLDDLLRDKTGLTQYRHIWRINLSIFKIQPL